MSTYRGLGAELRKAYDLLEIGVAILDHEMNIIYLNNWLIENLTCKGEPATIAELFGEHSTKGFEEKVQKVIKYQNAVMVSSVFQPWLLPLKDEKFPDGLMRQRGVLRPIALGPSENGGDVRGVLVQIRDVSNQMLQISQLKSAYVNEQKLKKEISEKNQELERIHQQLQHELEQARITQKSIMPDKLPESDKFRIAVHYDPMEEIGGDLYDFINLPGGKLGILVADVTGHGISAALISFMVASLFKTHAASLSAQDTISRVNDFLYHNLEKEKFATAFFGILDPQSMRLSYCSASHPPGTWVRQSGAEVTPLTTEGLFLGAFNTGIFEYVEEHADLMPGDRLYWYTDSMIEGLGPDGIHFGINRLHELFRSSIHLGLQESMDEAVRVVKEYSRKEKLDDDTTIVGIEIL